MGEGKEGGAPPPPKETSQGLPVVSENTINAIHQTYVGERWGAHLEEVKSRLLQENPALTHFIENQVGKYPPELHNPMFEVVVGTIAVLEEQAVVNKKQSIIATPPQERQN
jgi:hypothetical protein